MNFKITNGSVELDGETIIEEVNIMTPELIHLNSFMYEPLIDMSIYHLLSLYSNACPMASANAFALLSVLRYFAPMVPRMSYCLNPHS